MSQQSIGAYPTGMIGKIAGNIMNMIHNRQYEKIIDEIYQTSDKGSINIIDIGCGGGIAIKHFTKKFREGHIYGIDISPDMVNLAKRLNRKAISEKRVEIFTANVEEIDLGDKRMDLVTVFDNINFWNNYEASLANIKRLLGKNGRLVIVNAYPEKGTKWYEFVKFKDVNEYQQLLEKNGFQLTNQKMMGHTVVLEGKQVTAQV